MSDELEDRDKIDKIEEKERGASEDLYDDEGYEGDEGDEDGENGEQEGVVARAYRRSEKQSRQEREAYRRKRQMPFWITTLMIAGAAGLGLLSAVRLDYAGQWVPRLRPTFGQWDITEQSVEKSVYSTLRFPTQIYSRSYRNPMGEEVNASLVTAGPFENYHDPTVCVGGEGGAFMRTGQKIVSLDPEGKVKARAFIFQHRQDPKWRILMYYWQQNRDAATSYEPRMGTYQDIRARLETGAGAIIKGDQTCIIRIFGVFHEDADPLGTQTQRNVNEVSLHFYNTLREEGKKQ
jgi:Protein of unknown function (DUF3485)